MTENVTSRETTCKDKDPRFSNLPIAKLPGFRIPPEFCVSSYIFNLPIPPLSHPGELNFVPRQSTCHWTRPAKKDSSSAGMLAPQTLKRGLTFQSGPIKAGKQCEIGTAFPRIISKDQGPIPETWTTHSAFEPSGKAAAKKGAAKGASDLLN